MVAMAKAIKNKSILVITKRRVSAIFFLLFFLGAGIQQLSAQVGFRYSHTISPLTDIEISRKPLVYSISVPFLLQEPSFPASAAYEALLDTSLSYVTIRRMLLGLPVEEPHYYSFRDYQQERQRVGREHQWQNFISGQVTPLRSQDNRGRGITFETGRIKSEAFKKIFGGERVSLNINGQISIDGTMKHEKRSSMKTATDRPPNTNFQMKQKQNFTVQGKIGENITVDVDQNSENEFEFMNAVRLKYESDEDGIIKRIDAGNVQLNLPGTNFITLSQKNSGLFGLKAQAQIGRLDLTAIASMEKGQKKSLSLSGEGESKTITVHDYEYKKATYFFLDNYYRQQFANYSSNGEHIIDAGHIINNIQIYKSDYGYESHEGAFQAWAVVDPDQGAPTNASDEAVKRYFVRLEPVKDYYVNRELGYIQMSMPLRDSEILAVAYRDTLGNTTGDLWAGQPDKPDIPVLKLIKAQAPRPHFQTWDLEWKNVYDLGVPDITDEEFAKSFDVKIFYKDPSGQPKESATVNGTPQSFLHIFGLDDWDINGARSPDNKIDNNPNIINKARGEIIFPNLRPFDPQDGTGPASNFWSQNSSNDYRVGAVYDTTKQDYITSNSKFYMEITSSRRSAKYQLGINVIEGTEEILLNGKKLIKDVDYTIDYFSGTLVLTTPEATDPGADITINYESQRMFAPDKKVLLGARAEYTLWEQNNTRSFIGGTWLYLNKTTLDQRIRLGKEAPMRNMVWDVNTMLQWESDKVTRALNHLPLLDLSGSSLVRFEGEVAQISPNPNTLNNEKTGDTQGVAYLDDFEGSKRLTPMGISRKQWKPASEPSTWDSTSYYLERMGSLTWYNPYDKVAIQEIWPNKEVTSNFGGTTRTDVLTLDFIPDSTKQNAKEYWGGIQQGLSAGYYDQTDSRFLEIWVKVQYKNAYETYPYPKLHVDLGQISEDIIPNGEWDTEDIKPPGGIRDTNLEPEKEDTGLDRMFGKDPPTLFYPHDSTAAVIVETVDGVEIRRATLYDFWDLNGDNKKEPDEPWSYDDWHYTDQSPRTYRYDTGTSDETGNITGYEDNKDDGSFRYPDSEDMNGNSAIDLRNNYNRYSVSLDPNSPDAKYIVAETEYGWRQYRIPLSQPSHIEGHPDWSRVENIRLWLDGVEEPTLISFAEIELVSNEWKYYGQKSSTDSLYTFNDTDSTLSIAVINTHENPDYTPPEGVEGDIDPTLRIRSKEQSLVLQLNDLDPGQTALAKKRFYEPQNLIQYKTLRMFLHGGDASLQIPDGEIEYFLRFGSDTQDEIYYEVLIPDVKPGWEDNDIYLNFADLSKIKLEKETALKDTISRWVENQRVSIKGNPSLRNIRWLIVGVRNKGPAPFTGQLWMDELRLSNAQKDKGTAMRAKADIKIADLMSINAQYDYKDADFVTINERSSGEGSTIEGYNANLTFALDRLMPREWGLNIPISARIANSTSTPKYLPGSDILLSPETASDSVMQAARTTNISRNLSVRFSKSGKSRSFLSRYFLDPINGSFSYTNGDQKNPRTGTSSRLGYQGSFQYNLSFGKENYFRPFKWLGSKGFLKKIADTKLFMPSKINFKMDGNDLASSSTTAGGVNSNVDKSTYSRSFSTSWNLFTPLSFDYSLANSYDLNIDSTMQWSDVLFNLSDESLVTKTQNISTSFSPTISSWLSPSLKYSTVYGYNYNPQMQTSGSGKSATVRTNLTFSTQFNPQKLVSALSKKPSGGQRTSATNRRLKPRTVAKTDEKKEEEEKEDGSSGLVKILSGFGKIFGSIDPIRLEIRDVNNASNYGILAMPALGYQLGFTNNPGVDISPNLTSDRSQSQNQRTITVRSGFKITRQLSANLDYRYTNTKTVSTQNSQNISRSVLKIGDGNPLPIPNWTLRWTGLEKIGFLKKFIRSLSLDHSFTGQLDETYSGDLITQTKLSRTFRPVIGANCEFVGGIRSNFKYGLSETLTEQTAYGNSIAKTVNSDLTLTVNYAKRGGIKIPFLKGKKLDNNIDFSLTFSMTSQANLRKTTESDKFQVITENNNWSVKPGLTYSFTRTVRGGVSLEVGKRYNTRAGSTSFTAFGINAVISLSG